MGQMAGHWDTDKCTHHIWQVLMLFLGLFHLFHPFSVFLWFWVHLSLLSRFIHFHFLLVSSVSSHNLEFQQYPLSFSFIKRSAQVVHTRLRPALVSLWAGVGGKSGLVHLCISCFSESKTRWNVFCLTLIVLSYLCFFPHPPQKKRKKKMAN